MSKRFLTPPNLPSGSSLPSSGIAGDLFFKSDEAKIYVHDGTQWVIAQGSGGGGGGVTVSATPPVSPSEGDYWFDSTTTKSYIYYDSFWVEVGYTGGGYIVSETAPTDPSEGDVWFSSSEGVIYVYYDGYWVDPSTGGAAGVPSGGAAGAVLVKDTADDYDTTWATALTGIDSIQFDTTYTSGSTAPGELAWNTDVQDLEVQIGDDGNVTVHLGQEQYIRVKNNSGSTAIPKGKLVQFAGAAGDTVTVSPAVTDGSVPHEYMVGITAEEIDADGFGFVAVYAVIRGIDTQTPGWTLGTILYADPSTPGGLTSTEPAAPNLKHAIAAVVTYAVNGRILVRMTTGEALEHLHDVQLTSLADGETLVYNSSTGRWENGAAGSSTTVSTTAPSSPAEGDNWFNSETGQSFIYYDSYWVELGVGPAGPQGPAGDPYGNIDGGNAASTYGGLLSITGGSASSF